MNQGKDKLERDPRVVGCVFCGGRSRRMGTDKAMLQLGSRTLLQRAVDALAEVSGAVILATGEAPRYGELELPTVLDSRPDVGPLAGLEAALSWMEEQPDAPEWLLVLACDMPHASPRVLDALLSKARAAGGGGCLLEGSRGKEPLFACYHRSILPAVRGALDRGERRMIAFHEDVQVSVLGVEELPGDILRDCLANVNTPTDWDSVANVRAKTEEQSA